jgi:hypothetical protein
VIRAGPTLTPPTKLGAKRVSLSTNRFGRGPISGLKNASASTNNVVVKPPPTIGTKIVSLSTNRTGSDVDVVFGAKNTSASLNEF